MCEGEGGSWEGRRVGSIHSEQIVSDRIPAQTMRFMQHFLFQMRLSFRTKILSFKDINNDIIGYKMRLFSN